MSCSVSLRMVLPPLRMCGIASIEVLVLSVQGVQALSTRFTQKNNVIKNVKGYIFVLHTLHTCFFFVSAAKRPTFVRGLLSFVQGNPPVGPGAWGGAEQGVNGLMSVFMYPLSAFRTPRPSPSPTRAASPGRQCQEHRRNPSGKSRRNTALGNTQPALRR